MSDLFVPVCSVAAGKRRRFHWAAWWSGPPTKLPFRKPDAAGGGAESAEAALAAAEKAAGRKLVLVEPGWAAAWARVLQGQAPWTAKVRSEDEGGGAAGAGGRRHARPVRLEDVGGGAAVGAGESMWAVLGLAPGASLGEVKRAFRAAALELHPDKGGDAEAFRRLHAAYEKAVARAEKAAKRPGRKKSGPARGAGK